VAAVTWQERIQLATSEAEVIRIARDFLATLDRFEIALLPDRCAPRKLFVAEDVSSYAFDLVGYYVDQPEPAAKIIRKLALFFTHAAIRLSELTMRTNDDRDSSLRSA
jgi:hypothetical protein